MRNLTKIAIGAGAAVSAALLGGGLATAVSSDAADPPETEIPITGTAVETASAVALPHLGEGTVTGTEVGDEESYYEVEVTLDDGSEVDVQLDAAFNVVAADADVDSDD
jgi:hypothetical protein